MRGRCLATPCAIITDTAGCTVHTAHVLCTDACMLRSTDPTALHGMLRSDTTIAWHAQIWYPLHGMLKSDCMHCMACSDLIPLHGMACSDPIALHGVLRSDCMHCGGMLRSDSIAWHGMVRSDSSIAHQFMISVTTHESDANQALRSSLIVHQSHRSSVAHIAHQSSLSSLIGRSHRSSIITHW